MTIRTWLSAALVVSLVSLSTAPSLADSRSKAARYEPPARMEMASQMAHIAQSRSGRAVRAEPPPAPARAKQAKLEPKPQPDSARQAGSAANQRTGRGRR